MKREDLLERHEHGRNDDEAEDDPTANGQRSQEHDQRHEREQHAARCDILVAGLGRGNAQRRHFGERGTRGAPAQDA